MKNVEKRIYYFLAKFGFGTAENEPAKKLQNFAKNLLILLTLTRNSQCAAPVRRRGADLPRRRGRRGGRGRRGAQPGGARGAGGLGLRRRRGPPRK